MRQMASLNTNPELHALLYVGKRIQHKAVKALVAAYLLQHISQLLHGVSPDSIKCQPWLSKELETVQLCLDMQPS